MPRHPSTSRVRRAPRSARADATLAPAFAGELKNALAALRAALESVAHDLENDDPRLERVLRAAVQTLPLARQVEALADCARSTASAPGQCTLGEIAASVRRAVLPAHETRLVLALEQAESSFAVDAPLAVRTLVLPIEGLLRLGLGPVLLHVRLDRGAPSFRITWPTAGEEPEALALQRLLLRHEAHCLGAGLVEGTSEGLAHVELRFARRARGGRSR